MSIDAMTHGSSSMSEPAASRGPGRVPLLEIRDLHVDFTTQDKGTVSAVRGVNLTLDAGETLAIVGESGSGKSTTAHAIINLLPGTGKIASGSVLFDGQDLSAMNEKQIEDVRGG